MPNGKGDRNRITNRETFRKNFEDIMPQKMNNMSDSYPKKKKATKKVTKKKVTKKATPKKKSTKKGNGGY